MAGPREGQSIPEQVFTPGIDPERGAVAFLLFLPPKPSAKPNSVRQTDPRFPLGGHVVCPASLPPLVSPDNMTGIRAMPRHAFGTPPGDRSECKGKDDDRHQGHQDHPFADVTGHLLLHCAFVARLAAGA